MPDFDTSVPTLGENGWYKVFEDDFNGDGLNQNIDFGERYSGSKEIWTTSPHAIRWESNCLLYTSPSPRDRTRSRMPSSA